MYPPGRGGGREEARARDNAIRQGATHVDDDDQTDQLRGMLLLLRCRIAQRRRRFFIFSAEKEPRKRLARIELVSSVCVEISDLLLRFALRETLCAL